MRKGAKAALVGGVFAVLVGGSGYGAYNVVTAVNADSGSSSAAKGGARRSGPPTRAEVRETAAAFLAAWAKGDANGAAAYTDNASAAASALTGYREDAHIRKVQLTAGRISGTRVPFTVRATVAYEGRSKPLRYASAFDVVRGVSTGRALVDWRADVVHPDLGRGDTLETGEAAAPPIRAVDRDGRALTAKAYPSLAPVLDQLRSKYGDRAGGRPGIELYVRRAARENTDAGTKTLLTLAEGRAGTLRTTLSAAAQRAAEGAVARYAESSVVAVRPSTGAVLAVANHRKDEFNAAFEGKLAPGSTMKIVTAAMLIDRGVTKASGRAPCTPAATWQSQTFHNLKGMAPNGNATLADSFARSCNTAFVKLVDEEPLTDASLTEEAQANFGLGRDNWRTGITSADGTVPASAGPDRAANAIGQGQVQLNPLNLASVTATATTGTFRQPVLVPKSLIGGELATARGLSAGTVAQLRQLMRRTAVTGTGARAMAGLGGDIGAKTGSAEVDGQARPNSWFAGYRGDLAVAAMAQEGGHGGDTAGPIVAAVLRSGA
ncbi:penicillin-binding transpeptidase domain-containing protein [Streptomyces flavofungini]|uniref:Penicillin-binding protein n=1 Tax=Streptomyces flavofungini TaxID=68200 RepID=A0ABS0X085_9ACTN|nr:penicillin-binding transpeptidase domain-containing protein [Streptomyces flavofungini]MBJ3806592.1 penicillin-binding protein [Streptomyces flavofungini]GHC61841.1 penicillin-binding protein [Streptomyces flavofungini]